MNKHEIIAALCILFEAMFIGTCVSLGVFTLTLYLLPVNGSLPI